VVGSKASRAGAEDVVDLDHRAIGVWMVPLWPAGARHVGGEGRAMPEWYSGARALAEGASNW